MVPFSFTPGEIMKKIAKGSLVRLNNSVCFTKGSGGTREYPLSNYYHDEDGSVEGTRLPSKADVEAWRNSEDSMGMDCAGESKLPPTAYTVPVYKDRVYTVLRARCRPTWSYREQPGQALILDTETGREIYIKRNLLEAV